MSATTGRTRTANVPPCVLAIACEAEVLRRVHDVALATGAGLKTATLADAATVAAERRPLVMVIEEAIYAFDPNEIMLLARDVQSSLVVIEDSTTATELEGRIKVGIARALQRRDDGGLNTGRYTIIGAGADEAPLSSAGR